MAEVGIEYIAFAAVHDDMDGMELFPWSFSIAWYPIHGVELVSQCKRRYVSRRAHSHCYLAFYESLRQMSDTEQLL